MQTYESPIPSGSGFRYWQSGYTRQTTGGCGFWNNDADWANNRRCRRINNAVKNAAAASGLSNMKILEPSARSTGPGCARTRSGCSRRRASPTWTNAGRGGQDEWVNQIRTVTTLFGHYQLQENLHPNYWGELALRNCVRQAYNAGTPRGGTCMPARRAERAERAQHDAAVGARGQSAEDRGQILSSVLRALDICSV